MEQFIRRQNIEHYRKLWLKRQTKPNGRCC